MTKVFFVGIHNKPGLVPLCSSTKSGRIIDTVIAMIPSSDAECIKTNLCEVEYMPVDREEILSEGTNWMQKYEPENSIIVLLGWWTQNHFPVGHLTPSNVIVKAAHPASELYRSKPKQQKYIDTLVTNINSILLKK